MSVAEQEAMKYFHAYGTEMYYAHDRKRCWWGDRTREQDAEWHRRLRLWYAASGEVMP
jgi:hypothetical protein